MQDMTDLRRKRRLRLLQAAQEVFVASGFRNATMEGIAAQGGVSKATLYSYFPDKTAVFEAVAEKVSHDLVDVVKTTLDRIEDPARAALAALTAKHLHIHQLVRRSNFAPELFAANSDISKHHFTQADRAMRSILAHRLSMLGPNAGERAELLMAASQGIANATPDEDRLRARIAQLGALLRNN